MRTCDICGKEIWKYSKNNLCYKHYAENQAKLKIQKWLLTGDTGMQPTGSLRNCIRTYTYEEQKYKCAICGMENKWNGKDLKFVLDHIDGDASNNIRSNLRLICPNCDSQLDTFKSKNKHSARHTRRDCDRLVTPCLESTYTS